MEISDLVQLMTEQQHKLQQLTVEQEQEITDDITLLVVAICALNKWAMGDIVAFYDITEGECFREFPNAERYYCEHNKRLAVFSEGCWETFRDVGPNCDGKFGKVKGRSTIHKFHNPE